MNIPAEKLNLIEWLIQLQDASILEQLKALKETSESVAFASEFKPLTKEELITRAKASDVAIKEGRVSDFEDIENENW